MAIKSQKDHRLKDVNLRIRPGDPLLETVDQLARGKRMTATQYIRWLIQKEAIRQELISEHSGNLG